MSVELVTIIEGQNIYIWRGGGDCFGDLDQVFKVMIANNCQINAKPISVYYMFWTGDGFQHN